MELYKFGVAILKILLFGHFMAGNVPKMPFLAFSSHKMAKKQNFQNRYTKFVELHIEKLQTKFQVPSNVCKLSK